MIRLPSVKKKKKIILVNLIELFCSYLNASDQSRIQITYVKHFFEIVTICTESMFVKISQNLKKVLRELFQEAYIPKRLLIIYIFYKNSNEDKRQLTLMSNSYEMARRAEGSH